MMDRIEEIARALAANHGYYFDAITEAERNAWRADARAAYEVMTRSAGEVGRLTDDEGLRELRALYVCDVTSDAPQFTRWQMIVAMNHGKRLALTQSSVQPEEEAYARREIHEACKPTGEDHRRY